MNILIAAATLLTNFNIFNFYTSSVIDYSSYECEKITYGDGKYYSSTTMSDEEKERSKLVTKLVVEEMGADPELFLLWSERESKNNHKIVCTVDYKYNRASWRKHNKVNYLYKDYEGSKNFHEALVPIFKGKCLKKDSIKCLAAPFNKFINAWYFAYGSYSMNSAHFMKYWDPSAPPWAFCSYDGVPADVTAVWVARRYAIECGASYGDIDRRYSRGSCGFTTRRFKKLARLNGINPKEEPDLGSKFPENTNRAFVLAYMTNRINEECLSKELFRSNKCLNKEARGFPLYLEG